MKHPVWRAAPLLLAATFLASYAAFIFGVPLLLSQFADFKVQIPAPTMATIAVAKLLALPLVGGTCGVVLLSLAFAIAIGEKWAWWVGLGLTTLFGLGLLSAIMPYIAIVNGLSGADENLPIYSYAALPQVRTTLISALLPPLLFLALRRAFWNKQSPPTQTLPA